MLDIQLYGMNSGAHHVTSLLIHIINSVLLFLIFKRTTHRLWQSGLVAALFALHPLHVESVAWLSERKDVLSTFFWMLTMWSYAWYVESPKITRYAVVLVCFILGLMCKPMLVTLPFILLLFDYWPLQRWPIGNRNVPVQRGTMFILAEKIPFIFLSVAASIVTWTAQQHYGSVGALSAYPLDTRISNAVVSYATYILKMFFPLHLAFFYPHPIRWPLVTVGGAGLLLVSISFIALWKIKRYPYLAVGWLWYIGTLIPVIGLVQVGKQSMADRYTYVPLIGLFFLIAWGVPEVLAKWRHKKIGLTLLVVAWLPALMLTSWKQVTYWKNDNLLYRHALDVTDDNVIAHNNLGLVLAAQDKPAEAIHHYQEALRIDPSFVIARNNLGVVLLEQGRETAAAVHFHEAIRIDPALPGAYSNLARILEKQGKTAQAIRHYKQALRIDPNFVEAHNNLARISEKQGKTTQAIRHYKQALRIDPNFVEAHNNIGVIFTKQGRLKEAESAFRMVLRIDSSHVIARNNLENTLKIQKEIDASIRQVHESIINKPADSLLYYRLGNLYKSKGEKDRAVDQYEKALAIKPQFIDALHSLAITYAMQGEYEKGLRLLKGLIKRQPDRTETYYLVASIYARQQHVEKSIHWLKQALKRGYDDWGRMKTDSNLENLRSLPEYQMLIKDH
ncbi:MAG: tetratricopeptide repeat protein [Desulfobacterales bacterium]|nr:MAG: tetratricopeptide repeat protein [Desulfobacterales bacterium]